MTRLRRDPLGSGTPTSFVGVDPGAISVKMVVLQAGERRFCVVAHRGRPLEIRDRLMAELVPSGPRFVGVCGHQGTITEVAAIHRALEEWGRDCDAVVSLGGESFLVYVLEGRRVLSALSHNKCAAGSGEFLMQQIGRMGLELDEAIARSFDGKVVPLASRCSVHCKSDVTHKLNRKEATIEDVLHTLHDSMAEKVVALLDQVQATLRRVLLIGGVSQNRALVATLRRKLPGTEFVVLEESPWFEAWGTALLMRDAPRAHAPEIRIEKHLQRLPPLAGSRTRVRRIEPSPVAAARDGSLALGVDAGSTTTKAVLLEPETRAIVASHYRRTDGDPVRATKLCLRVLIEEAGNRTVGRIAATGSAREIVGAFLGTEHVYNEISAQAAGAAHYDRDVDTIFEIGGQDAKYIHLRSGVPVDYAMNAACSAGTGSFLEESASGDLDIAVTDIAATALEARSPVRFKATCAAFINSDIRIALQKGGSPADVAAGLVYAIADNYLSKVKGPRFVGRRVFLQGGVALNDAVACAFAHHLDREVVVPPQPELLGAQGVGLLALERADEDRVVDLETLCEPAMEHRGSFTCKACALYCTVDRFEVAGRRFPFGGRCSRFENVWKRKERVAPARDLVEERSALLFASCESAREGDRPRIGVPRALCTHSLYPLFCGFLERIGFEVVLSGIDPAGQLKAHSGFCFPTQIAHGAVLDLVRKGIDLVFFPHVVRMPNPGGNKGAYLCPITQAGPYVLTKAFSEIRFLSPQLDFRHGYESDRAFVEMATENLGVEREFAESAFSAAVADQLAVEASMHRLGGDALAQAVESGEPVIVLMGRSYNAFTPDASQSVGRKLASMGVTAIPADCLENVAPGPMAWHFSNTILNAVAHAKRLANLYPLYVTNFSCTIDSFTHELLRTELGDKPYLVLEIDAHTADAGVQTRLEAFLDIVRNHRASRARKRRAFAPARLLGKGRVVSSSGEEMSLGDPRVKLHFPAFSRYHSHSWSMAARWLGLHPGTSFRLDRRHLEEGLRHTSGRECLPVPICVGQLLQIHRNRKPGEVRGLYMLHGGAPCVADSIPGYFQRFIEEHELEDLFMFAPHEENGYFGMGAAACAEATAAALTAADLMAEIENTVKVVGREGGVDEVRRCWEQLVAVADSLESFREKLPHLVEQLSRIPRDREPDDCPRVVVTGDFFTRFSDFFMEGVADLYTERGIILKPVDLNELMLYTLYDGMISAAHVWGLQPGPRATVKACTRILEPDGKEYLTGWYGYQRAKSWEKSYRRQFERTGLLVSELNDVSDLVRDASAHISPLIYGEAIVSVGKGVRAEREGYDGVILIGPFNCLPFRISEAILKPYLRRGGAPILSYESDGYAVPPAFLRQVEVHIQQVLERWQARPAPAAPSIREGVAQWFHGSGPGW